MSNLTQKRQAIAKATSVHIHSTTIDIYSTGPITLQDTCIFKYDGWSLEVRDVVDFGAELIKVKSYLAWIFMLIEGTPDHKGLNFLGYEIRRSGAHVIVHYRGSLVSTKSGLRAASNIICKWYKTQETTHGHV